MNPPFQATELAHDWVRGRLRDGDVAIDATAGNGHDTLFLAQLVGQTGRVYAFDVQTEALEATRALLEEHGLLDRVTLIQASHEELESRVPCPPDSVRVILFNLGYLPGGEKTVITRATTTLAALDASLRLLAPGGLLTIVGYSAHKGGEEETEAVVEYCKALNPAEFRSIRCQVLNFERIPPYTIAIEKRSA